MVEDGGADGCELLHASDAPETLLCLLTPLDRHVGDLGAILQAPTNFLVVLSPGRTQRGNPGSKKVCHNRIDPIMPFQHFPLQFQFRVVVAGSGHVALPHLALLPVPSQQPIQMSAEGAQFESSIPWFCPPSLAVRFRKDAVGAASGTLS